MPPSKASDESRRKSGSKPRLLVTLKLDPKKLRDALDGDASPSSQEPADDIKQSPDSTETKTAPTNGVDNASDSNAATPQPDGTPAATEMPPPGEGPKKKGVKRSAANANGADGTPKVKGKPGPKKKPRLEDGTIDHAAKPAAHKLGPKANQGAINAGLRALDRSGKPCRKWNRGGFVLKSFTGTVWQIPRWTAPPKKIPETSTEDSNAPSADNSSSKENKDTPADHSAVNSNSGADAEMRSAASNHASSPAPVAITTVS